MTGPGGRGILSRSLHQHRHRGPPPPRAQDRPRLRVHHLPQAPGNQPGRCRHPGPGTRPRAAAIL